MINLADKTAIVTGANTGLGYEMARSLSRMGAQVIIASRNEDKALAAIEGMRVENPDARVEFEQLDLASLASVRQFAKRIIADHERLDLLINNAGVMVPPASLTEDGYEMQFGVNFLAHFSLSGRLFGLLESTPGARVVTLSSIGHRGARIDFSNFSLQKPYDKWREYGQSKLADLIFALEFDRRLRAKGCRLASLAAHPGISQTELTRSMAKEEIPPGTPFMSAADGAAPALVAATSNTALSGQYYGPDGPGEISGPPALAAIDPAARDAGTSRRLWEWAERVTGVSFP